MSKKLAPDDWVDHIEQLRAEARKRARDQRTDAYGLVRDRDYYDDDAIRTVRVARWQCFDGMTKSSSWTRERFTVEYVNVSDDRVTFSCTCETTGQCVHRARKEWIKRYNCGSLRDDDPERWTLSYDDYKQNGYEFDWELLD